MADNSLHIAAEFIRQREGCKLTAYQDEGGVWTIGYGHTGPEVVAGLTWTMEQAEAALESDLLKFSNGVRQLITVPLTDKQRAALLSFTFNEGLGRSDPPVGFAASTLRALINQGDFLGAADQFPRWCVVAGRKSKGLKIRRLYEAALFLEGTP